MFISLLNFDIYHNLISFYFCQKLFLTKKLNWDKHSLLKITLHFEELNYDNRNILATKSIIYSLLITGSLEKLYKEMKMTKLAQLNECVEARDLYIYKGRVQRQN